MKPIVNLWNLAHGRKTYTTAVVMALLGVAFLLSVGEMTWEDPGAGMKAAVRNVVGWLFLTQAAGIASLRHAIGQAGRGK